MWCVFMLKHHFLSLCVFVSQKNKIAELWFEDLHGIISLRTQEDLFVIIIFHLLYHPFPIRLNQNDKNPVIGKVSILYYMTMTVCVFFYFLQFKTTWLLSTKIPFFLFSWVLNDSPQMHKSNQKKKKKPQWFGLFFVN